MMAPPAVVVVMGVSGCGKSTVGRLLAQALGVAFVEGDDLHPPRNVALMAAGTALTDADRLGWLQALAALLANAVQQGQGVVMTCSALKRSYRDLLRGAAPTLRLVWLHGSAALLSQRLQARSGHYMPASLLQSQLDTLQPPGADERALALDIAPAPDVLAASIPRQWAAARAGAMAGMAGMAGMPGMAVMADPVATAATAATVDPAGPADPAEAAPVP